ncbi:MAG: glycosyltransferase family 2 protein [Candidatus Pacebacteria bacterium]|nr:glycosyltransferase family 2 protein [Candidatus Paceibacterota bacterium]
MIKLSVIVNHYQTPEILKICLKSIKENLSDAGFDWEIIVTDSATIEKTEEMMDEYFSDIIFIPAKENIGFGKSINIAIEKACGEYFFIVNADILIEQEKAIEKMLEYIEKDKEVGMVGPKLLNVNNTIQQSCFRFYTPLTVVCRRTSLGRTSFGRKIIDNFLMKDVFSKGKVIEPIPVDWLMGSAMMVRKSDLKKVGAFDENFFMYFEDVDWARRFWENGLKVVYYPESTMYHYHFQSSKKKSLFETLLSKYARIHIRSALKYFIKYKFKKVKYGL